MPQIIISMIEMAKCLQHRSKDLTKRKEKENNSDDPNLCKVSTGFI
jgi:hypothetical protein